MITISTTPRRGAFVLGVPVCLKLRGFLFRPFPAPTGAVVFVVMMPTAFRLLLASRVGAGFVVGAKPYLDVKRYISDRSAAILFCACRCPRLV